MIKRIGILLVYVGLLAVGFKVYAFTEEKSIGINCYAQDGYCKNVDD